jgi:hypothetical protein
MQNVEVGAIISNVPFAARLAGHFDMLAGTGLLKALDLQVRVDR